MKPYALALLGPALLLAGCSDASDSAAADGDMHVKAHTLRQLMANVVQPNTQIFWDSAGSISDASGITDLAPTTDEGWEATRTAAATVTEMGNLLLTPQFGAGKGDDWNQFSRALVQVGIQAEQAAVEQDADKVFEIGGTMYNVCKSCHEAYITDEMDAVAAAEEAAKANKAE